MLLAAAALVLVALPVSAQSDDATTTALKGNLAKWSAALVSQDAPAIDRMMAPNFLGTDGEGKRFDKAAYLNEVKAGPMKFSDWQPGPEQVTQNGATAVHMGEGSMTVTAADGTTSKVHFVWTTTWVKGKGGKWVCLAAQWVGHPM
jgi:ketosteroid isomerase-like protein